MAKDISQYMVDFTMPDLLTERFSKLIPEQRALVNDYFGDNVLVSYAVSLETGKVWAIFNGTDEEEVKVLVTAMPLTRYMTFTIHPLTFYNILTAQLPNFSVN
jgi:hypothetical protein